METMAGMKRSCGCGKVSENDVGKELTLAGWVNTRRDHGGLIFIDLRDRSGIVQLVMSPQYGEEAFHKAEAVRSEYVLAVKGKVRERSEDTVKATVTGELDDENLSILVTKSYIEQLGHLTPEGYWDFNWSEDRFVINGITYKPSGDTQVAQAKDEALVFMVILKRDRDTKIQFVE